MTASPTANPVTPAPSSATVSATSTPGVCGSRIRNTCCMDPARMAASTGLNPFAATRRRIWPASGRGRATSS